MSKGWTEERRQKARERILQNKPWEKSTGPRTAQGKKRSALNAVKHGGRSRIWGAYLDEIMALNKITLHQAAVVQAFSRYDVKMTNELIKKYNNNKTEGPP